MSPLVTRVAAIVGLLLVPLALAVASQALASSPGAPDVDPAPVRLEQTPAPRTPDAGPGQPEQSGQPQPSEPSQSPGGGSGPRVVDPVIPDDDDLDDDRDDDGPDDDDDD